MTLFRSLAGTRLHGVSLASGHAEFCRRVPTHDRTRSTDLQAELLDSAAIARPRSGRYRNRRSRRPGEVSGVNASANLPAASTIKIPGHGRSLQANGSGLDRSQYARRDGTRPIAIGVGAIWPTPAIGTERSVNAAAVVDDHRRATTPRRTCSSVWSAATHINAYDDDSLGLASDALERLSCAANPIRSATRCARVPKDMVALLDKIARERLVDEWSSREMLAILAGQHHNGLITRRVTRPVSRSRTRRARFTTRSMTSASSIATTSRT